MTAAVTALIKQSIMYTLPMVHLQAVDMVALAMTIVDVMGVLVDLGEVVEVVETQDKTDKTGEVVDEAAVVILAVVAVVDVVHRAGETLHHHMFPLIFGPNLTQIPVPSSVPTLAMLLIPPTSPLAKLHSRKPYGDNFLPGLNKPFSPIIRHAMMLLVGYVMPKFINRTSLLHMNTIKLLLHDMLTPLLNRSLQ